MPYSKIYILLFIQTIKTHPHYVILLFSKYKCNSIGFSPCIQTSLLVPLMGITKLSSIIRISILLTKIIIGAEYNAIMTLTKQNTVKQRKTHKHFNFYFSDRKKNTQEKNPKKFNYALYLIPCELQTALQKYTHTYYQ